MNSIGIDISSHYPKSVDNFTGQDFDYVITVCDNANENCPVFTGNVKHRAHLSFEDPAKARGSEEQILSVYRRIRDEIEIAFRVFYEINISKNS